MFLKRDFSHYKQEVMVLKESLECVMFLKRDFSHYKQEVMVLKESLECVMFLKRVLVITNRK